MACVRGRGARERVSHDNLFHSVLGLMQVQTQAYQQALDPYAGCQSH